MTLKEAKAQLSSVAPTALHAFRSEQKVPYIVFCFEDYQTEKSDDGTMCTITKTLVIDLYTDKKDPTLESKIENGILKPYDYQKTENYFDTEKILAVTYTADITEKG
mgnify:FL=1